MTETKQYRGVRIASAIRAAIPAIRAATVNGKRTCIHGPSSVWLLPNAANKLRCSTKVAAGERNEPAASEHCAASFIRSLGRASGLICAETVAHLLDCTGCAVDGGSSPNGAPQT